ncbi:unnamed protein product [Diamesa serratosioi]
MEFSQPPPDIQTNMAMPPPNFQPQTFQQHPPRHFHPNHHHKPGGFYKGNHFKHGMQSGIQDDFDGKRLRKSVMRKTVDYNSSIVKTLENRIWQRDHRDRRSLQPETCYIPDMLPPSSYLDNPSNAITTRFVKTATNKMRCPVFTLAWTPEGRRLITGASSGEFTLWNGLTFNFETILQAHTVSVRAMVWSHNDNWMVTGDHNGFVKYWQSNMNNVKMFQAHKEPIRGISFCPSDAKFASCSDDGTVRVFDFLRCQEERVLRGHGADVKCVHWHPQKSLIVSGSKDNQQPIKLWDPKCGQAVATLHAHKSTVMDLKWNDNGNWLVTASRDHLLKLFDLRNLKEELQVFRGHKKEASSVAWHPIHEGLFTSGGSDGQILFWNVGIEKEIGGIETAHESIVWTLAWHPMGHILCSGSNDHTVKFWTRNRPGDQMRDKYNLNTLPASMAGMEEYEMDEHTMIPGMGMGADDKVDYVDTIVNESDNGIIPGLDLDTSSVKDREREKKVPYSKPIPKNFQAHWNEPKKSDEDYGTTAYDTASILACVRDVVNKMLEALPGTMPLESLTPQELVVYGKTIPVEPNSKLSEAILNGSEALYIYIHSGEIEELADLIPHEDFSDYTIEDFIAENAKLTIGEEEDGGGVIQILDDEDEESDGDEDVEPSAKRFRREENNHRSDENYSYSNNNDRNDDRSRERERDWDARDSRENERDRGERSEVGRDTRDTRDTRDRDWETKMAQMAHYNNNNNNSNNNNSGTNSSGGIPSLLNLTIDPPPMGMKDLPKKSPPASPWETSPFTNNNGAFNQNNNVQQQNSNNINSTQQQSSVPPPRGRPDDNYSASRRERRPAGQSSGRWSSTSRR